jgi:hypothetical protein
VPQIRTSKRSYFEDLIELTGQTARGIHPSHPSQKVPDLTRFAFSGQCGAEFGFQEIGGREPIKTREAEQQLPVNRLAESDGHKA